MKKMLETNTKINLVTEEQNLYLKRLFAENLLEQFDEGKFGELPSFEILKRLVIVDKEFRAMLNKKARQKFAEIEDVLKEFLAQRENEIIIKAIEVWG